MIDLKTAQIVSGMEPLILQQHIENKAWHSTESPGGQPLVCLESLLQWEGRTRKQPKLES
jgi:hypothetical protein